MTFDFRALADYAWGWATYGAEKVLALLKWAWAALRGAGNYVIDPPPMHLKRLFWITLPVVLGVWAHGAYSGYSVVSWVKDQFGWGEVKMHPVMGHAPYVSGMTPRLPSVVTTTMLPPAAPVATPSEKVGQPDAKAQPVAAAKAEKKKRKAKKDSPNFFGF